MSQSFVVSSVRAVKTNASVWGVNGLMFMLKEIISALPTLKKPEACAPQKYNLLTETRLMVYYLTRKKQNEFSKIPF